MGNDAAGVLVETDGMELPPVAPVLMESLRAVG
jgi:hypothetical protein